MGKEIELIPFLEKVLNRTTTHYKEDFQNDIVRLQQAARDANGDRVFYWMARPCGTWLMAERDVFLRGSFGHAAWTHYADIADTVRAYRVTVTGGSGDMPLGTVHRLNYPEQVKRVEAHAIPAVRVEITFLSGQQQAVPVEQYENGRERLFWEHGPIRYARYCPEDEAELVRVLAAEYRCQKRPRAKSTKKRPQAGAR